MSQLIIFPPCFSHLDFPKFEYLHQRANQAVAELKARELAEIFAAEDAAEAAAAAAEDEE